ncbi:UTP--glucose-1-phosphate uridylyltransferase [Rickettsiales endosymbiont of Peranema trichophorum]|nr:UTP--glucose-1-phosphate uridylyltransferase [Rickettsiales endosymbiont of Peranema trichophorum]
MPKEMLPVASKPLIQHAFEEAVNAGIEQFIFITGRNKNAIINHFDHAFELEYNLSEKEKETALELTRGWLPKPGNLVFIRQQQPLGLGHAIWCARHLIKDEYFAILLADDLFINSSGSGVLDEMINAHQTSQTNLIGVGTVPAQDVYNYGIVEYKDTNNPRLLSITGMIEKPSVGQTKSNQAIMGRYILHSSIFEHIEETPAGRNGEVQLTDAMVSLLASGTDSHSSFHGHKILSKRLDCGTPIGFLEANMLFALHDSSIKSEVSTMLKQLGEAYT